jgi:hypothetical protein
MALTKEQMTGALATLITDGHEVRNKFLKDFLPWTPEFVIWLKGCESTIEAIYSAGSEALRTFKGIYFVPPPDETYADAAARRQGELVWYENGLRYALFTISGMLYSLDRLLPATPARSSYSIFISHGGPTMVHVDAVAELLQTVGLQPVVVAKLPNMNMSVNEKVLGYLKTCVAGIALATEEDEIVATNEKRPRPNVENEIGMLQAAPNIQNRIVYCKEAGVKFASNYAEKVWITFAKERAQDVFVAILKELRAFRLV